MHNEEYELGPELHNIKKFLNILASSFQILRTM